MPPASAVLALTPRQCEVCHKSDGRFLCSGCQAVYYCGRAHQTSDRGGHRKKCSAVKKARDTLKREEDTLRNMPEDEWNLFETGIGHFWRIHETRPYMRARYEVVDRLLREFGTAGGKVEAVQRALDHLVDMLRLSRGDNMGVRDVVPPLFIRLGRDQDAYDFVKWYATTGQQSDYDWGNMDLPFLDVKGADVLEPPPKAWCKEWLSLSHATAAVLIKIRVLIDLQAIQNVTRSLQSTTSQEITELVRGQLVGSIVDARPELLNGTASHIKTIKDQIGSLYVAVGSYNKDLWPSLFNPADALASRPAMYSPGSKQEAHLIVNYSYAAWAETPGAIETLKSIVKAV